MFHYLFTNDLRISILNEILKRTSNCFLTDTVPSASENKSENNNMLTIGFYFNFTKDSQCAKIAASGNTRDVVLNFIKKFQFPNPRTVESFNYCSDDNITLAPMRIIVQTLYMMKLIAPGSEHLSREEILDFVFYNSAIAKTKHPDIVQLVNDLIKFRSDGSYPSSVERDASKRNWKHEDRQIREMTKVLTWSGCVSENDQQELIIDQDNLSIENKAALFDILTFNDFWNVTGTSPDEIKASYQKYMDMVASDVQSGLKDIDLNKLKDLKNKEFVIACLDILKKRSLLTKENVEILCSKELCGSVIGFPSYSILRPVDLEKSYTEQCYISGNNRYYPDQYTIDENLYFITNNWYPEYREKFLVWVASILNSPLTPHNSAKLGDNIILYGVPGCGKSHKIKTEYCDDEAFMERVVFHPDYTYSDFVGQILPENIDGHISYPFVPGPFTRILKKAVDDKANNYYLVIEELNRGNAPAIFGEVFQLLDRMDGESEYGINNADIAKAVYGDSSHSVKIPYNLFLLATMNTADQNVFTLDTAFKRRWKMRSITNDISKCLFADYLICDTNVSWRTFIETINSLIVEVGEGNISSEDKRLGAFFLQPGELNDVDMFAEKVLMYLWNDAFKYDHDKAFKPQYKTLEKLIEGFKSVGFAVFSDVLKFAKQTSVISSPESEVPDQDEQVNG